MIQHRVLTRGVAGPRALTLALDELGIQNGEEFVLVRADTRVTRCLMLQTPSPPRLLTDDEMIEELVARFDGTVERASVSTVDQDRVGPHVRGSDTSAKAALMAYPRTGIQRRTLLDALEEAGGAGLTRDELEDRTGIIGSTVRPRVVELIEGGWARATERTRPSRTGEASEVLVATFKAEGRS